MNGRRNREIAKSKEIVDNDARPGGKITKPPLLSTSASNRNCTCRLRGPSTSCPSQVPGFAVIHKHGIWSSQWCCMVRNIAFFSYTLLHTKAGTRPVLVRIDRLVVCTRSLPSQCALSHDLVVLDVQIQGERSVTRLCKINRFGRVEDGVARAACQTILTVHSPSQNVSEPQELDTVTNDEEHGVQNLLL